MILDGVGYQPPPMEKIILHHPSKPASSCKVIQKDHQPVKKSICLLLWFLCSFDYYPLCLILPSGSTYFPFFFCCGGELDLTFSCFSRDPKLVVGFLKIILGSAPNRKIDNPIVIYHLLSYRKKIYGSNSMFNSFGSLSNVIEITLLFFFLSKMKLLY